MGMFDFLLMADNYEDRAVDRFESEDMIIDTCFCNDGKLPYETAVQHKEYNDNKWIIVENYPDKEQAQKGHDKWVAIMTSKELPEFLQDCQNAEISEFLDVADLKFYRNVSA